MSGTQPGWARDFTGNILVETLSAIFELGITGMDALVWERFTMAVARVSRRWRHITLSLPSLWSVAHVRRSDSGKPAWLKILELFTTHSRDHPLYVHINLFPDGDDWRHGLSDCPDKVCPQSRMVFPLLPRWRILEIVGVHPRFVGSLRSLRNKTTPILSSLTVAICPDFPSDHFGAPLSLFEDKGSAPVLQSAALMGFFCQIPMTSVTSLRLGHLPAYEYDFRQLVEASRQVVRLQFVIEQYPHWDRDLIKIPDDIRERQEFPHLRQLELCISADVTPYDVSKTFFWIKAPSLVSLSLDFCDFCRDNHYTWAIAEALAKSGFSKPTFPRVTTLRINNAEFRGPVEIDSPLSAYAIAASVVLSTPAVRHIALFGCLSIHIMFQLLSGTSPIAWAKGSSSWSMLQTLSLSSIDVAAIPDLCQFLRNHVLYGTPIDLKITPAVANIIPSHDLEVLWQSIVVEVCETGELEYQIDWKRFADPFVSRIVALGGQVRQSSGRIGIDWQRGPEDAMLVLQLWSNVMSNRVFCFPRRNLCPIEIDVPWSKLVREDTCNEYWIAD